MEIKYIGTRYWYFVLIPSVIMTIFGSITLFFCHGECGAGNHGGMLMYMHNALYIHIGFTISFLIFGTLGSMIGTVMLFYWYTVIYEAYFDLNGISYVKQRKKTNFIPYSQIDLIEYHKPTLFNYIFKTGIGSYNSIPGRLYIHLKEDSNLSLFQIIRIKKKHFSMLPENYKRLIESTF